MFKIATIVGIVGGFLISTTASAQVTKTGAPPIIIKNYEVSKQSTTTNISGQGSSPVTSATLTSKLDGPTKGDFARLTKLTFWEYNDDPAKVDLEGIINYHEGGSPKSETVKNRVATPDNRMFIPGDDVSKKTISVSNDRAITSLQVCINNQKVKGVRIWGANFDNDGKPKNDSAIFSEFKRPNCGSNQWVQKVSCPAGKVAVGLRVENSHKTEEDGNRYKGFMGLSLICATYTHKPNAGKALP